MQHYIAATAAINGFSPNMDDGGGTVRMRSIAVQQFDAFTTESFAGNPAGVVIDAATLTSMEMQQIAREMNCSETVFIMPSEVADMRMRYFTPAVEVDLCGHATIAGLSALGKRSLLSGALTVETNVGTLKMEVRDDGSAWMRQASPQFQSVDEDGQRKVAELLGIQPQALGHVVPLGLAYTGLWDLMVPVNDLQTLFSLSPSFDGLAQFNRDLGVASTHVFCMETKTSGATLHARDFSPAVGVPEDPHTGTASGALGAWLVHNGVLEPGEFIFEQGWSVGRPGLIHVRIEEVDGFVWVGGHAVEVLSGQMILS
jgi:trans-2,3-dihydro-3-hydroxyanthranilate isomerase